MIDDDANVNDPALARRMADVLHDSSSRAARQGGLTWTARPRLTRFRATIAAGKPVIGAGAGTGISAKSAEAGGVDLIIIYNSGRYRMAGRGSLVGPAGLRRRQPGRRRDEPRGAARSSGTRRSWPGVNGTDPFRLMGQFLDELKTMGFSGVQNFPTVGLFDGVFRQNLEETGMGYDLEVEMIRLAAERDLLTAPYVFDVDSAIAMTRAGADVLVPHMGLTTSGTIGATTAVTPRRSGPQGPGDARRRGGRQPRRHRALPRRTDRRTRGRRVRAREHHRRGRLLRRLLRWSACPPNAPSGRRPSQFKAIPLLTTATPKETA